MFSEIIFQKLRIFKINMNEKQKILHSLSISLYLMACSYSLLVNVIELLLWMTHNSIYILFVIGLLWINLLILIGLAEWMMRQALEGNNNAKFFFLFCLSSHGFCDWCTFGAGIINWFRLAYKCLQWIKFGFFGVTIWSFGWIKQKCEKSSICDREYEGLCVFHRGDHIRHSVPSAFTADNAIILNSQLSIFLIHSVLVR